MKWWAASRTLPRVLLSAPRPAPMNEPRARGRRFSGRTLLGTAILLLMMPLLLWAGRDKWVALADGDLSIRQEDDLVEEQ